MKVAVSISDEIFAELAELAKRLKTSRSEIFSRALREFIGHRALDRSAALMNDVVSEVGDEPDGFSVAAGRLVLSRSE
jgi:metal-responsive CopG/Arc/MetJ family transcriptional regulator